MSKRRKQDGHDQGGPLAAALARLADCQVQEPCPLDPTVQLTDNSAPGSNCCAYCFRETAAPLTMCRDCNAVGYCSAECWERHMGSHKPSCNTLCFMSALEELDDKQTAKLVAGVVEAHAQVRG